LAVANGERYPGLRSVILCTEDSIRSEEVEAGLAHLAALMPRLTKRGPSVFIRPRNPQVLQRILAMRGIERIDGFVLPKVTAEVFADYVALIPASFALMPTLETREAFDPWAMAALRQVFLQDAVRGRILALRIGGNDLLNLIGVRRKPGQTLYDTAIGQVIAALVTTFLPDGFALTAPVFDNFGDPKTLDKEVLCDIEHGLIGKTAIHPHQIERIERHYKVAFSDLEAAQAILMSDAPAVFQIGKVMCEPATHTAWAKTIVARAALYGTLEDDRPQETTSYRAVANDNGDLL
jgi:citrate lyase beta subunit